MCKPCNERAGSRFVPAYSAFARTLLSQVEQQHEITRRLPGTLDLRLSDWELGDVARAGLMTLMALGVHDRLLARYPTLSRCVDTSLQAAPLPDTLRLGLTLGLGPGGRLTAPVSCVDQGGCVVFSEVAMARSLGPCASWRARCGRLSGRRTSPTGCGTGTGSASAMRPSPCRLGFLHSPVPGDYRPPQVIRQDMPDAYGLPGSPPSQR